MGKHPYCKAWDKWLASDEGQSCSDIETITKSSWGEPNEYLVNRLRKAFRVGLDAGRAIEQTGAIAAHRQQMRLMGNVDALTADRKARKQDQEENQ